MHLLLTQICKIRSLKIYMAFLRLINFEDRTAKRTLAASRFSYNSKRFPLFDRKTDVIYCSHILLFF